MNRNNYNFTYHTQKYTLKYIIELLLIKIKYSLTWESLGKYRSNIHAHYLKFSNNNIFIDTYKTLIQKYINNNKSKYVYTDSTAIINKGGKILVYFVFYFIDKIKKNKYYYGKNCNKINLCIDDNKIPIDTTSYKLVGWENIYQAMLDKYYSDIGFYEG